MKFKKRPGLTPREIGLLVLIGLTAVIVVSILAGVNIGLSRAVGGGGGFLVLWEGARTFIFSLGQPYSDVVSSLTQQLAYGKAAGAGQNPYFLTMPFFLLLLYSPLAVIPDPTLARGVWLCLSEVALVGTALIYLRLIEWQPRSFFVVLFSLLSLFNFYAVDSLLEGSPSIILGLLFAGILFSYFTERDELAGALLALSLFSWEVSLPILILFFWRVSSEKRTRVITGLAMTLVILVALSFLLYPGWVLPYLTAVIGSIRSMFGMNSGSVIAAFLPANGILIARIMTVVLLLGLVYEVWLAQRADSRQFVWTACLALAVTPLLGQRTDMSNLVVIFPGLALIFASAANRSRLGFLITALLFVIVLLLPWGYFVQGFILHDPRAWNYLFLFYPLFTIVGLYWTRWWFIRPPRTWLDQVRPRPAQGKR